MMTAVGVGDAVTSGVAVAVGEAVGLATSSLFELFDCPQTMNPKIMIPAMTAAITRPEAPCFLTEAGG